LSQHPLLVARRTVVVTGDSDLDESFPSVDARAPVRAEEGGAFSYEGGMYRVNSGHHRALGIVLP